MNSALLAVCGVLNAICSAIYWEMYQAGPDTAGWHAEGVFLSRLTMMAGAATLAAGLWRISWPLISQGLALGVYGLLPLLSQGPLSFRLFAGLIAVMALSYAALANQVQGRLFRLAATASIGFALGLLCLATGWIQLERRPFHPAFFLWLCFSLASTPSACWLCLSG